MSKPRPIAFPILWSVLFASLLSAACRSTVEAQEEVQGGGIDLVLLVDISRSNWESETAKRNGSDPDRIRWDAVKLVLDLLGPADRVMVQRFNDNCPPAVATERQGRGISQKEAFEKYGFFTENDEFADHLQFLNSANRKELGRKAGVFNRRNDFFPGVDAGGVLDYGGTKIIDAMQVVASRLKRQPLGRPTHVILLTDGLDEDFDKKNYGTESVLRRSLSFFADPNHRIPIHTIGLNLDSKSGRASSGSAEQQLNKELKAGKARQLLRSISHITGGEFKEARSSADLIPFFLEFMRKLKGYWLEKLVYEPGGDREVITPRMVVNGIIDLGIMSYEFAGDQSDKKFVTRPPQTSVKLEWKGLQKFNYSPPPAGPPRSVRPLPDKKGDPVKDAVYNFFYFGPAAVDGKLGRSPFAQFENPVKLEMHVTKNSDIQHLVLLKGTAELFRLISPAPEATFQRTQKMAVRVAMADSPHFKPEHFQVFAKLAPLGELDREKSAKLLELQPESALAGDHQTDFVVRVPLTDLPFAGPERQLYEVAVWIEGKTKPEIPNDHALSGNRRDLSARSFAVENKLELNPITNVELTEDRLVALIPVSTALNDVVDKLELSYQFIPPATRVAGKLDRLPPEIFKLQPPPGKLVLKQGKAMIRLELPRDQVPAQGVPYSAGRIVLSGPAGIPMTPRNPSASISLRLSLSKVELKNPPTLMINPQTSQPLSVALAEGQPKLADVKLKLALEPVDTNREEATFSKDELWLYKKGDEGEPKTQTIEARLDEPIFVRLEAANKRAGKYRYRIRVTSDRIDPVMAEFSMDVEAPRIVTDRKEATVYLSAGKKARFNVNAWISNALPGRTEKVHVKDITSGQRVRFKNGENLGPWLSVKCSDQTAPIELRNVVDEAEIASKRQSFAFEVDVPADTPYGHFWYDFDLVGNDVIGERFRVHVIVDGLEIDFVGKDPETGEDVFEGKPSEEFILNYRKNSTRRLRIRTGRNTKLKTGDIRIGLSPFRDDGGDVQETPRVSSQLAEDDRVLIVTIDFPKVTNANGRGFPYRLKLFAESRKNTIVAPNAEFRFDVRILATREITPPFGRAN